jgi:hypothetical protein
MVPQGLRVVEVSSTGVGQALFVDKYRSWRRISSRRLSSLATSIDDLPVLVSRIDLGAPLSWSRDINVLLSVRERVVVGYKRVL